MYVLPRVMPRMVDELPAFESQWNIEVSPIQQFDALMEDFCLGVNLTFDRQFKPLCHIKDGIWELKTPDLRIFGWFVIKDIFIAGAIDTAFNVKNGPLYVGYAREVAYFRDNLNLNEPKFVTGTEPQDVISNYDFA